MSTRAQVYTAIDSERNYQNLVRRNRCAKAGVPYTPNHKKPVEDWLIYLWGCYQDAIQEASQVDGNALEAIRKLAGLCVGCLEDNDAHHPSCLPRSRTEVYHMIEECKLQDGHQHTINGSLVMFGFYLQRAQARWTLHEGETTLEAILFLARITVDCLGTHGSPRRRIDEGVYRKKSLWDRLNPWRAPWA